ncbi:MAG TPA: phosphoenolpyruvate mutase [Firmicutes bacterium]|nr:phosphoenolpyruvate mutase [Bacillota bacterium]
MKKIVYIAMSTDILHEGHIKVINEGAKYGEVVIGLLSDKAISEYKRMPLLTFEERKTVFENIKNVSKVVRQDFLDYTAILRRIKPDYVVHGDDWKEGVQQQTRAKVIETLKEWGGQLIEVPYTRNVSSSNIEAKARKLFNTPDRRRAALKKMIASKPYVRVLEADNGLTGLIDELTFIKDPKTGFRKEFDAMWVSSLCDSTFKGKPDIELIDQTSRINTINEIMEVTTKPIILDGDTGGKVEHFVFNVKTLERIGVSAIIIEDKTGLKQNSLFGTAVQQIQEDPDVFSDKIRRGKLAQVTKDFMIIARCESLIAGRCVEDALMRCRKYIAAGADGIMIHSKEKDGREIFDFMAKLRKEFPFVPIILVPTSYNQFTEEELCEKGANVIIYANHLVRSAFPAMKKTAESILFHGRSKEASEEYCMSIKDIITLIPTE